MFIVEWKVKVNKLIAIVFFLAGVPIAVFFGVGILAFVEPWINEGENKIPEMLTCVILAGLGILLIVSGKKRNDLIKECRRYAVCLAGLESVAVEEFSRMLGNDSWKTRQNLDQMISRGYLENVELDKLNDCIVILVGERLHDTTTAHTDVMKVPVTCGSCDGITMIPVNSEGICDYCGSRIHS